MKNMKKKLLNTTLLIVAVASLSACTTSNARGVGAGTNDGQAVVEETLKTVAVETIILEPSDHYEQIYLVGQLEAKEAYNVLPYTAGLVSEILVEVGDEVEAGDVLYLLDSDDLMTTRDDTLVSLQRAKDQAYNSLILAKNDLSSSEMTLSNAEKNYKDNLRLFEGGFITQSALDGYEDVFENSQIAYDRVGISLQNTQSAYESAVDSYEDSVRDFSDSLGDMTITSPIAGTVTKIDVQVDVNNNMNAGVTVTGSGDILVTGSVIEKYINLIEVGQQSSVEIKAVGKTIEGQVTSVAMSSGNSYYPIEVTLENDNGNLKAGMFAGVTVDTTLIEEIITVPKTSILGTGSTKYVYLNVAGLASKAIVTLGREFGDVVEITQGLAAEDVLIVEGHYYLDEGTSLTVNNEDELQ